MSQDPEWALGFMTGTSMDGVDCAFVRTDGHRIFDFGPTRSYAFSSHDRMILVNAAARARQSVESPDDLYVAMQQREAVEGFHDFFPGVYHVLDEAIVCSGDGFSFAKIIGVHGQTLVHAPDERLSLQLFDPGRLGAATNSNIVYDFRTDDIKAGGQGAPLAPFFHFALSKRIGSQEPLAFLNIGGVANVTWVNPSKEVPEEPGALLAFDTGPGNALIDDWMQGRVAEAMDRDGAAASAGRVQRERLGSNAARAYLDRVPPKSLDRNDFAAVFGQMEGLSVEDGAATLTAFTVDCVVESLHHMPSPATRWLVCGGGRRNRTMMGMLAERLDAPVEPVEAVGLDGDMLEAQAFAYLAVRVLRGLPTSAPSTTGCLEPVCGGRIHVP
ncbi:MAG: anhydro-N-acetylmuramic acid kinase [Pseudomonadota bacterium]